MRRRIRRARRAAARLADRLSLAAAHAWWWVAADDRPTPTGQRLSEVVAVRPDDPHVRMHGDGPVLTWRRPAPDSPTETP